MYYVDRWDHIYAPAILSPSAFQLIDYPTPYIIGLIAGTETTATTTSITGPSAPEDAVVFDIDNMHITVPSTVEELLHANPLLRHFQQALAPELYHCDRLSSMKGSSSTATATATVTAQEAHHHQESLNSVKSVLSNSCASQLVSASRTFITDALLGAKSCSIEGVCGNELVILFDENRYLDVVSKATTTNQSRQNRKFYEKFMKTQAFSSALLDSRMEFSVQS